LLDPERQAIRAGLRSPDAFTLRRSQILLQSADGRTPARIADSLGCSTQTVRNAIRAFQATGLDCLRPRSHRPASAHPELDGVACERLRALGPLALEPLDREFLDHARTVGIEREERSIRGRLVIPRVGGRDAEPRLAVVSRISRMGVLARCSLIDARAWPPMRISSGSGRSCASPRQAT
jgi:transposase